MSQSTSTPTTRAASIAEKTSTITRAQLIARRPGAVTRGAAKVAQAAAPITPGPTPAKLAAQRRKDAARKAAKEEVAHRRAQAIMAAERDEEVDGPVAAQATAGSAQDMPPLADVDDALAGLHLSYVQQSKAHRDESDDERDVGPRQPALGDGDDADDDFGGGFEDDDDHGMDVEDGPDIFDATTVAPTTRKRRAQCDDEFEDVDDDVRTPLRKSAKVIGAEFTSRERIFLKHVKNISRAEIITENAYHSPYDLEDRITATMHRTAHDSRYGSPQHVHTWNRLRDSPRLARAITYVDYTNQACRASTVCFVRGAIHLMGIPRAAPNAQEAERITVEDVHWIKTNRVWQYGSIDLVNRTFDVLKFGQAEWVVEVATSLLITQRSRLDVDAFAWVMEAQEIPLSLLGLILTCGNHVIDEYAGGRWERKPFTVASATTYTDVMFKLRGYELDFPDLLKEWKVKVFEQACERARKGWLVRTEVTEDGEAVKMMMQAAQDEAARRARMA